MTTDTCLSAASLDQDAGKEMEARRLKIGVGLSRRKTLALPEQFTMDSTLAA